MKILLVGSWQGWMGLHLRHFSAAFAFAGHEVFYADYTVMRQFAGLRIRAFEQELLDRRLEKQVRKHCPDLILFVASWKFDLRRLRFHFFLGCQVLSGPDRVGRVSLLPSLVLKDLDPEEAECSGPDVSCIVCS